MSENKYLFVPIILTDHEFSKILKQINIISKSTGTRVANLLRSKYPLKTDFPNLQARDPNTNKPIFSMTTIRKLCDMLKYDEIRCIFNLRQTIVELLYMETLSRKFANGEIDELIRRLQQNS